MREKIIAEDDIDAMNKHFKILGFRNNKYNGNKNTLILQYTSFLSKTTPIISLSIR